MAFAFKDAPAFGELLVLRRDDFAQCLEQPFVVIARTYRNAEIPVGRESGCTLELADEESLELKLGREVFDVAHREAKIAGIVERAHDVVGFGWEDVEPTNTKVRTVVAAHTKKFANTNPLSKKSNHIHLNP